MIGLHQFETEQIPLGGGRSRGLGVVKLDIDKMLWIDVDNNPEKLLQYLQTLVNEDNSNTSIYEDGKQFKNTWTQSLINHLTDKLAQNSTNSIASGG